MIILLEKLHDRDINIAIFIIMILLVFTGYTYTNADYIPASIWPAIGFAIGFYMYFKEKVQIGLLGGLLTGYLLSRYLLIDEIWYLTIIYSFTFTAINFVQLISFKYVMEKLNSLGRIDSTSGLGYITAIPITAFIGAILSALVMQIFGSSTPFMTHFLEWFIGDLTGILIFGTLVLISYYYDTQNLPESALKNIYGILFLIIFIIVTYYLLDPVTSGFTFQLYGFILILFFFTAAITFSYRMLITMTAIILFLYHYVYISVATDVNLGSVIFSMNSYLFIISLLSAVTRMMTYNLKLQNRDLLSSNEKLDQLINSTHKLFRIKDIELTSKENNIKYIKEVFHIASNLYTNFDKASCYVKIDDEPYFIDAIGYNVDTLNDLGFNSSNFKWALDKPEHVVNAELQLEKKLGKRYKRTNNIIPDIEESIRFGVFIDEDMTGGASFDILEDSEKKFTKYDFDNYDAFQRLMNTYYQINHLNNKNMSLKNDIVHSLIQTLELYDQYTGGHSEEVAILSREVAIKLELSESELYDIYWAGIVHDIGKVGISSDIINKVGKLTKEEYETVKSHPLNGSRILEKSEDLKAIARIVKHHHEWWNGNGYPDGIAGNSIPLGAQMLCLCDAVSSMHGKRSYQESKSKEEILHQIELYKGAQFSPVISDIMIELIHKGILDKIKRVV